MNGNQCQIRGKPAVSREPSHQAGIVVCGYEKDHMTELVIGRWSRNSSLR